MFVLIMWKGMRIDVDSLIYTWTVCMSHIPLWIVRVLFDENEVHIESLELEREISWLVIACEKAFLLLVAFWLWS